MVEKFFEIKQLDFFAKDRRVHFNETELNLRILELINIEEKIKVVRSGNISGVCVLRLKSGSDITVSLLKGLPTIHNRRFVPEYTWDSIIEFARKFIENTLIGTQTHYYTLDKSRQAAAISQQTYYRRYDPRGDEL